MQKTAVYLYRHATTLQTTLIEPIFVDFFAKNYLFFISFLFLFSFYFRFYLFVFAFFYFIVTCTFFIYIIIIIVKK
jgi:hypothetical protein